jgi:hypothetical protein
MKVQAHVVGVVARYSETVLLRVWRSDKSCWIPLYPFYSTKGAMCTHCGHVLFWYKASTWCNPSARHPTSWGMQQVQEPPLTTPANQDYGRPHSNQLSRWSEVSPLTSTCRIYQHTFRADVHEHVVPQEVTAVGIGNPTRCVTAHCSAREGFRYCTVRSIGVNNCQNLETNVRFAPLPLPRLYIPPSPPCSLCDPV